MAWFHQWLSMGSPWQRRYANTLERAAASTTSCLLKEYYHSQVPLASLAMADLPLLVFDLEMTGLDANKDQIVSIGWVGIDKGKIALATAGSCILAIDGHIGQSACIHGIVDSVSQEGISLTSGLEQLITAAHGRLLVAHHAPLDLGFLAHHGKQVWGEPLCLHAIDTL
ncbi:MAG: 3'-5' exonuclease, partial [Shewanella sp.]